MAEERLIITLEADVKAATQGIQKVADDLENKIPPAAKAAGVSLEKVETLLTELLKASKDSATGISKLGDSLTKLPKEPIPKTAPEPVKELSGTIGILIGRLPKLRDALFSATDPKQIERLNSIIAKTNERINLLTSSSKKLGGTVANANPTLVNFGRVIQDAPFGLIGIANNIDPLISSFQSLKQSSGSTGGALKALFSSLAGPAGIAIGVSAVTSALIAFGPQIKAFFSGVKEVNEETKKFNEELDNARAGALKTGVQLQSLIAIVQDETKSQQVRDNALKKVNETTKQYGINITQATIANGQAVSAVDALTNALIAQAVAAKLADKIADLRIKEANALKEVSTAEKNRLTAQQQLVAQNRTIEQQERGINEIYATEAAKARKNAEDAAKNLSGVQTELADVTKLLNEETAKGLVITKQETDNKKLSTKAAKERNTELKDEISLLSQRAAILRAEEVETQNAGTGLLNQLKIQATEVPPPDVSGIGATVPKAIEDALKLLEFNRIGEVFDLADERTRQLSDAIGGFLAPSIDAAFQALANGDNVFEALGKAVKGFVLQLAAAVAKAVILQAILSAFTGGASVAGAGGGGFFKNILGGLFGGRAGGGPVSAGAGYIVGESGPEKFIPSVPGMIVPNNQMGGGTLTAKVSGQDLLFILNQAQGNRGRNFA